LIIQELAEIVANYEYEKMEIPETGYLFSWPNCSKGRIFVPSSNLRRTILGTSAQMMQQWTGINFIFYFGTTFFKQLGTINNPFLISLITALVNVCSTPIAFWLLNASAAGPYSSMVLLVWSFANLLSLLQELSMARTQARSRLKLPLSVSIYFSLQQPGTLLLGLW
jgi:hypothetical protein